MMLTAWLLDSYAVSAQTEKTNIKALIELCPAGASLNYKLLLKMHQFCLSSA